MRVTLRRRAGVLVAGIACLAAAGCDASFDGAGLGSDSFGEAPTDPSFDPNGGGGTGGTGSGSMDGEMLPPEVETTIELAQPQASERFVYAANPEGGTVAIIDAQSLAIQTLETGNRPTYLRTLAGTDDAIVLNLGSNDATIIRDPAGGASTSSLPVVPGANSIAVTADGTHAVVWFDASQPGATSGSGSFQDVTVLFLEAGSDGAVDMTVGFRPRSVFFSTDGKNAYVVNEDGVSILDFARVQADGSHVARLVSLGADIDQQSADVAVTPDGAFALARDPAASELRLVDLGDGRIRTIDLAALPHVAAIQAAIAAELAADGEDAGTPLPPAVEVTDLDLAASGAFAIAVLRNQSAVVRIPIPNGFESAASAKVVEVSSAVTGSVTIAPTSDRALLYTTATLQERITILDLGDDSLRPIALRKSVEAVAIAPDGETALIVNRKLDGNPDDPGLDPDVAIDRSHGYSVLRLDSGDVKLQVSPTRPGSFTLLPDSSFLFMAFRDDVQMLREVHQVDMTSFLVTPYPLGSPPIGLGAVPSVSRVFVSQDHPDGRLTLIDWTTGEARTVTGFELNSRIRD